MSGTITGRRAFGPYVADLGAELLWRDAELIHVPRKSFQVLSLLIQRHGEVLEKNQIFAAVWGQTVVEDNTLARHVAILRRILGDAPTGEYIATVPGWGYRFVAEVTEPDTPAPPVAPIAPPPKRLDVEPMREREEGPAGGPIGRRILAGRGRTSGALAAGVCLLLALTLAPTIGSHPTGRSISSLRGLRQITYGVGLQQEPTWSPDGTRIAYASDRAGNMDIWVQPIEGTSRRQLTTSPAHDSQPSWSPDGRSLVFRSERDGGGLYVVGADGLGERRVAEFGYRPRWSPDGRTILFWNSDLGGGRLAPNVFVVDAEGGTPRAVLEDWIETVRSPVVSWVAGENTISIWAYGSDGEPVLAATSVAGQSQSWTIAPAVRKQLALAQIRVSDIAWAPSGRYLYFEGEIRDIHNIWRVGVDVASQSVTGPVERLTTSPGLEGHLAVSPDGRQLAFSERVETRRLHAFPFDSARRQVTGPGVQLTSADAGDEEDPVVSSDGAMVVYRAARDGRRDLWQVSTVDGRERLLLSDLVWRRSNPHWSRDGFGLVYTRTRIASSPDEANRAIVVMSGNGGPEQVVATAPVVPTDWSPDGSAILGGCAVPGNERAAVCLLPIRGPGLPIARVVASDPDHNLFAPRFSPDQEWISFTAVSPSNTAVSTIYGMRLSGGPRVAISDRDAWDDKVRWAADGRTVYWVSNRTGRLNVWGRGFDPQVGAPVGAAFPVTSLDNPRQGLPTSIRGLEIAFTGDKLIVPMAEARGSVWVLEDVDR